MKYPFQSANQDKYLSSIANILRLIENSAQYLDTNRQWIFEQCSCFLELPQVSS